MKEETKKKMRKKLQFQIQMIKRGEKMEKIGEKFIEGRIVNLDRENLENLESYAKSVAEKEDSLKSDLDGILNEIINQN